MDEVEPKGLGGCPPGEKGMEGWASKQDIVGKDVDVQCIFYDQDRRIQTKTKEFFYIDRTNREIGLRTSTGGRMFVCLDDILGLLRKEAH